MNVQAYVVAHARQFNVHLRQEDIEDIAQDAALESIVHPMDDGLRIIRRVFSRWVRRSKVRRTVALPDGITAATLPRSIRHGAR